MRQDHRRDSDARGWGEGKRRGVSAMAGWARAVRPVHVFFDCKELLERGLGEKCENKMAGTAGG